MLFFRSLCAIFRSNSIQKLVQYNMKNKIYTTATLVTALSIAERGLGFLYRIALSRFIGAEGLGIYQVALSLFSFFLTIGTGGIPITVSRMISKSKAERSPFGERRAVSAGLTLSLLLTLPICLIFLLFGEKMSFLFSDKRTFSVFKILLGGLVFSSVYAVIRGHFWGNKEFLLPSFLEIAEESVMAIAGISLFLHFGAVSSAQQGAERAAVAVIISYLFSFTAACICFFVKGGKLTKPQKALKPLFNSTLPITSVRASTSLVNSLVAVLLPIMLLKAGASETEALKLFGIVSGMAVPVLFIPSTIIGSISLVLVPELSEDFYRKNFKRLITNIQRGLHASFLIACILIPFFFALGQDLGQIAFSNVLAGEIIQKSCFILLPMSLTMISTGMLNSMGFERKTLLFFFLGAAAMLLCILFLPAVCGVYAYVWGLGASYCINAFCNIILLKKSIPVFKKQGGHVRVQSKLTLLIVTILLSAIGKLFSNLCKFFFGEIISVLICGLFLSTLTLVCYALLGIFSPKQWLNVYFSKKKRK